MIKSGRLNKFLISAKLLEKTDDDNKIENVKVNQGAVNNTGNQIPNPQDAPEKDDNKGI